MSCILLFFRSRKVTLSPPLIRIVNMAAAAGKLVEQVRVTAQSLSFSPSSLKTARIVLYGSPTGVRLEALMLREHPQQRIARIFDDGE
jgi:hypothetical protein